MKRTGLVVAGALLLVPFVASAHAPSYLGSSDVVTIPDADTSRAYYGELTGRPAEFTIALASTTDFYVNVLAPDIPGARTDFTVVMRDAKGTTILELNQQAPWEKWYEEFAGDSYLKGPEVRRTLELGRYTISVSNPDNQGKYVLAPGEAEVFTAGGIPETIAQIYSVKTKFFEKPWYTVFQGIIGKVLLGITILILLAVAYIAYRVFRKSTRHS